jgi:hypothetical protein
MDSISLATNPSLDPLSGSFPRARPLIRARTWWPGSSGHSGPKFFCEIRVPAHRSNRYVVAVVPTPVVVIALTEIPQVCKADSWVSRRAPLSCRVVMVAHDAAFLDRLNRIRSLTVTTSSIESLVRSRSRVSTNTLLMPRSSYSPCWPPSDPIDRSISTASPPCSLRRLANPQAPINPGPHLAPASQARQRHRRQTTPPRSPSIERWPEPLPHFAPGCHRYRPIRPRLPTGQRPAVERGHCPTSTGVRTRPRKAIHAQSGYTWAYDEHAAARAEQVVGDVAARLVNLSGEAGDVAGIQWVIQRARRGLDGPTAELPPDSWNASGRRE